MEQQIKFLRSANTFWLNFGQIAILVGTSHHKSIL